MITVRLITRSAGEETTVVDLSGQESVPRKGETVVLDGGRRFEVNEVVWRYSGSVMGGPHTMVVLAVQEICQSCIRPVWPDDDPDYPTCRRCVQERIQTRRDATEDLS